MTVVYLIGKILTFPGAFLKALWEHCVLRLLRVPVEDESFLHMNELFGHVEHSLITEKKKNIAFCLLPGIMNGILSIPLLFTSVLNLFYLGVGRHDAVSGLTNMMFFVYIVMFWVGLSLWCSKYPLFEDVVQMREQVYGEKNGKAAKILLFIPTVIVYVGSFLERYGINVLLAAGGTAALIWVFPYAFI